MRRHPALVELSRDHHQALFVALRLRQATVDDAPDARAALLAFWREGGAAHFAGEEAVLVPAVGEEHPVAAAVLREHAALRGQIADVEADADTPPSRLHALGHDLAAHVRREERELFPLLEARFDDAELERLAAATAAAEREHQGA